MHQTPEFWFPRGEKYWSPWMYKNRNTHFCQIICNADIRQWWMTYNFFVLLTSQSFEKVRSRLRPSLLSLQVGQLWKTIGNTITRTRLWLPSNRHWHALNLGMCCAMTLEKKAALEAAFEMRLPGWSHTALVRFNSVMSTSVDCFSQNPPCEKKKEKKREKT